MVYESNYQPSSNKEWFYANAAAEEGEWFDASDVAFIDNFDQEWLEETHAESGLFLPMGAVEEDEKEDWHDSLFPELHDHDESNQGRVNTASVYRSLLNVAPTPSRT